jgi:hypothetical protein
MKAENNPAFLVRCVQRFPKLSCADRKSGCIYAEFAQGRLDWTDADAFARTVVGPEMKALFYELAPDLEKKLSRRHANHCNFIQPELYHTIGRWA